MRTTKKRVSRRDRELLSLRIENVLLRAELAVLRATVAQPAVIVHYSAPEEIEGPVYLPESASEKVH